MIEYILKGFFIGFAIAIPVGPIGLLCIRRTLANGRFSGIMSGLGAATADGIYGTVAAFGITFVSDFIVAYQMPLRFIGGLFLCYLAYKAFFSPVVMTVAVKREHNPVSDYFTTMLLTLTNPVTIFAFAAVFAAVGVGVAASSYVHASAVVLGVMAGSATWWTTLSSLVSIFASKCTAHNIRLINRVSGVGMGLFGIAVLISFMANVL